MADKPSLARRWGDYRASKALVFWSCVASVVATLIVGFGWGGWMRDGTAQEMATKAAAGARAELAAAVCLHQFVNGANATTQLASLKGADSWKRDAFIEEGGWVTLPGVEKPVTGAASLCAQQLIDAKLPPKAVGTTG
jgi:hypothetical protein